MVRHFLEFFLEIFWMIYFWSIEQRLINWESWKVTTSSLVMDTLGWPWVPTHPSRRPNQPPVPPYSLFYFAQTSSAKPFHGLPLPMNCFSTLPRGPRGALLVIGERSNLYLFYLGETGLLYCKKKEFPFHGANRTRNHPVDGPLVHKSSRFNHVPAVSPAIWTQGADAHKVAQAEAPQIHCSTITRQPTGQRASCSNRHPTNQPY